MRFTSKEWRALKNALPLYLREPYPEVDLTDEGGNVLSVTLQANLKLNIFRWTRDFLVIYEDFPVYEDIEYNLKNLTKDEILELVSKAIFLVVILAARKVVKTDRVQARALINQAVERKYKWWKA